MKRVTILVLLWYKLDGLVWKWLTLYEILHYFGEHMNADYVQTTFPNDDKKFQEFYKSYEDEWLGEET